MSKSIIKNKNLVLFLIGSFGLGLSQAFMMLFLNFYLKSIGLDEAWQGFINAMPAFTAAFVSLPAVLIARKITEANTIKIGTFLTILGTVGIIISQGPLTAVISAFLMGIGNALNMVSNAPFIASQTTKEERVQLFTTNMALITGAGFIGNMLGGRIPEIYGRINSLDPKSVAPLRAALITAVILQSIGFFAILFLKQEKSVSEGVSKIVVEDKSAMFRLVVPNVLVGIGAGFTIPFINIFIESKFHVSYSSLGQLFGWTSLATAVTVLIQPYLVRKFGQINTILIVQLLSLPFLIILGFAPYLWLVVIAMFTRGALMNAGSPVYTALAMDRLSPNDRPMFSALNLIGWNGSWAVAASVSGFIRRGFGQDNILFAFNILFILTLLAYSISIYLLYIWIYKPIKKKRSMESNIIKNESLQNKMVEKKRIEEASEVLEVVIDNTEEGVKNLDNPVEVNR